MESNFIHQYEKSRISTVLLVKTWKSSIELDTKLLLFPVHLRMRGSKRKQQKKIYGKINLLIVTMEIVFFRLHSRLLFYRSKLFTHPRF